MKPSLRVLVISLKYPPCSISGYRVMCAQVCEWLRRRGHNVQVLTSVPLAVPAPGEGFWQAGSISVRWTLSSYSDGRDCLYPPFREALAMEHANQAQFQGRPAEYWPDVVSFWNMVGEDGTRDNGMINLAQLLPGKSVVGSGLAIMGAHRRGHLTLSFPSDHITGGPDMRNVGAQGAIYPHGSRLIYLHSSLLQADLLRIGASPGGQQEPLCRECLLAAVSLNRGPALR